MAYIHHLVSSAPFRASVIRTEIAHLFMPGWTENIGRGRSEAKHHSLQELVLDLGVQG